jgi:hypothetical protein
MNDQSGMTRGSAAYAYTTCGGRRTVTATVRASCTVLVIVLPPVC